MATKYSIEFIDPASNGTYRVVFAVSPVGAMRQVNTTVETMIGKDALGATTWKMLPSDAGCYPRVLAAATFLALDRANVQEIDDPATV